MAIRLNNFGRNGLTNTCCLYWEKKLNVDIDWSKVFKRNLAQIRESKLREFNLKLLYNLLPVRSNLFKWGISNDDVCPTCNIKEDMNHAFIECKLIEPFIKHIKEILRDIIQSKDTDAQYPTPILKIDCESHCILFFTIAFWTIYKLIVKRNITGIDKRKVASKQNLHREIIKRMESKLNLKMNRKLLPKELLGVI